MSIPQKRRLIAVFLTFLIVLIPAHTRANNPVNAKTARQLFNTAYKSVYGAQGSTLSYAVNLVGLYKTTGTISMKGKKKRFFEPRYSAWCNGKDYYKVDNKRKEIEIHSATSPKKDKYSEKFSFSPNNFNYSYSENRNEYIITLDAKPKTSGNIKHAQIYLDKTTKAPKSLKIKVLFFWTTIKISNFHSGGINDEIFNFPKEKFKNYKITDKRPD